MKFNPLKAIGFGVGIVVVGGVIGIPLTWSLENLFSSGVEKTRTGVSIRKPDLPLSKVNFDWDRKSGRTELRYSGLFFDWRSYTDNEGDGKVDRVYVGESLEEAPRTGSYERKKDIGEYGLLFERADREMREQRERFAEHLN